MLTPNYRIGNGVDVHPLKQGKKLILGGVDLQHTHGCDGHSDGDVLIHSIIDSILGALNQGDIGSHFPSSDNSYKNISSITLLSKIIKKYNFSIINIDSTIILQSPQIQPHIKKMKENIIKILCKSEGTSCDNISIKATTTDNLGFIGHQEGVAAITTCLLIKND